MPQPDVVIFRSKLMSDVRPSPYHLHTRGSLWDQGLADGMSGAWPGRGSGEYLAGYRIGRLEYLNDRR